MCGLSASKNQNVLDSLHRASNGQGRFEIHEKAETKLSAKSFWQHGR